MIRNNIFSITASLIILYLSLSTPQTFVKIGFFDIPYLDKFAHFALYFFLMGVIIIEHRYSCTNTRKLLLIALIPFFLGISVEFLQSFFTTYRSGEILDMIADSAGIAAAIFLWLFIKPYYCKENFR
jgi:VanZ family protein